MIEIGEVIEISIMRQESNFDRACDAAYQYAIMRFDIDQDGHSSRIRGWERSRCSIEISFVSYIRTGNEHLYVFNATTLKCE